ncbi:MAG: OmpH family outer membrane protein [Gammaproteobacteria bacterium]|nr:OmpH family outer membrane protein [Gammaproteobacteria bacterium]
MFNNNLVRAALVVLCSLPVTAMAQSTLKVGVVDFAVLLQQSPQVIAADERLQDEFAPRQRELIAMQTALEEKATTLQKNLEVMGQSERENAQRNFRDEERAFVRAQNELREDLDLRRNEVFQTIQRELAIEIKAYAEAEGFDLILVDGVLHYSDKVSVTAEVLERLRGKAGATGQ